MDREPPTPTVSWALFGFRGRLGRQAYALGQFLMLALMAAVVAQLVEAQESEGASAFWGFAFLGLGLVSVWSSVALTVKRLADLGWPAILALVLFVPWAGVMFVVALMVLPSRQQPGGGDEDGRGGTA